MSNPSSPSQSPDLKTHLKDFLGLEDSRVVEGLAGVIARELSLNSTDPIELQLTNFVDISNKGDTWHEGEILSFFTQLGLTGERASYWLRKVPEYKTTTNPRRVYLNRHGKRDFEELPLQEQGRPFVKYIEGKPNIRRPIGGQYVRYLNGQDGGDAAPVEPGVREESSSLGEQGDEVQGLTERLNAPENLEYSPFEYLIGLIRGGESIHINYTIQKEYNRLVESGKKSELEAALNKFVDGCNLDDVDRVGAYLLVNVQKARDLIAEKDISNLEYDRWQLYDEYKEKQGD